MHIVKIRIKILPIYISLRNLMKLRMLRPLSNMRIVALINLMNCLIFSSYSCMNIAYWIDLWIRSTSNVIVIQWALVLLVHPLLRLRNLTKVSRIKFLSMCYVTVGLSWNYLIINYTHTLINKILIRVLSLMH